MQTAVHLVTHYGYAGIFSLLALGIVGLPIPDETLLTFVGYLIFQRQLHPAPAFASAFLGAVCGITLSYGLGRSFDSYAPESWRRFLRLSPERIEMAHDWFRRGGQWVLVFGYFVPGVRHLTAYAAGASELAFPTFASFAYSGGLLWSTTFIAFGYFLGEGWDQGAPRFERNLGIFMTLALIGVLIFLRLRKKKDRPA
jgi:membrane protein DedA with SNARE-associated domain